MVHILFIIEFCLENLKLALLFQRFFESTGFQTGK